jgi:hypothetical protein
MTMCLTHSDFLDATIAPGPVSEKGAKLGLTDGMSGVEALNLSR